MWEFAPGWLVPHLVLDYIAATLDFVLFLIILVNKLRKRLDEKTFSSEQNTATSSTKPAGKDAATISDGIASAKEPAVTSSENWMTWLFGEEATERDESIWLCLGR